MDTKSDEMASPEQPSSNSKKFEDLFLELSESPERPGYDLYR